MVEQDFYDQLVVSPAGQEYLDIIKGARGRPLIPEAGYETHHIFPTSLGGLNININKVKLTIFEHCKVHALLAQAIPCYKTLQPLTRMSLGQVTKISDAERVTLDEIYNWASLREKALHHPKSREHVEKARQTMLSRHYTRTPEHIVKMSRKGMISINNGEVGKLIYPEELDQWLAQGWVRGRTPAAKARISKGHIGLEGTSTGYKAIHRGDETRKVKAAEVERYLAEGWQLGESELICRKRKEGKLNAPTNLGKIRIKKDGKGKVVSKDELQSYLDQGWVLGIVRK